MWMTMTADILCVSSCVMLLASILTEIIQGAPVSKFLAVEECPANQQQWLEASKRINCSTTTISNRYHCMPNKGKTILFEFCYIHDRVKVTKGYCLEIVTSVGLLDKNQHTKCDKFVGQTCPSKHYDSDKMYLFPGCSMINKIDNCYTSDPACPVFTTHNNTAAMNYTTTRVSVISDEEQTTNNSIITYFENSTTETSVGLSVVIGVICVLFIILVAGIVFLLHKRRRDGSVCTVRCLEGRATEEHQPLLDQQAPVTVKLLRITPIQLYGERTANIFAVITLKNTQVDIHHFQWQKCPQNGVTQTLKLNSENIKYSESSQTQANIVYKELLIHNVDESDEEFYQVRVDYGNQSILSNQEFLYVKKALPQIEEWKACDDLFYETCAFREVEKTLQKNRAVTIIGASGSGKKTIARHVALKMERNGWKILKVQHVFDLQQNLIVSSKVSNKCLFVFCHPVGKLVLDTISVYLFRLFHLDIAKKLNENVKLLMTCNDHVYDAFETEKMYTILNEKVIDLRTPTLQLTSNEKSEIFTRHCDADDTVKDHGNQHAAFPLLCFLFSKKALSQEYQTFFKSPETSLVEYFENLERTRQSLYAFHVLCLYLNKTLTYVDLLGDDLVRCNLHPLDITINIDELDSVIEDSCLIDKICISENGDQENFVILHDLVFKSLGVHLGKNFPSQILKRMHTAYIARNISCNTLDDAEKDKVIRIPDESYECLAERLYYDIKSMSLYEVFSNACFQNKGFTEKFCSLVARKSDEEIQNVFLSERQFCRFPCSVDQRKSFTRGANDIRDQETCWYNHEHLVSFEEESKTEDKYVRVTTKVFRWVVFFGLIDVVKSLISKLGNDCVLINDTNEGVRLVNLACCSSVQKECCVELVSLILKQTCSNCINNTFCTSGWLLKPEEFTPLILVYIKSKDYLIDLLIENGADLDRCSETREKILIMATKEGNKKFVEKLITLDNEKVNDRDTSGLSLLMIASKEGKGQIVKFLLKNGANVNMHDKKQQRPLHFAIRNIVIAKTLIKEDANVNACDAESVSPLFLAAQLDQYEVVKLLVNKGANVFCKNKSGRSPLHEASKANSFRVVEHLVRYGADVDALDKSNKSPLHCAAKAGNLQILQFLLKKDANINMCDITNTTPLLLAMKCQHLDIVTFLIGESADVNICDNENTSVLHLAFINNNENILTLLWKADVKVDTKNKEAQSLMHLSAKKGDIEFLKFLLSKKADINAKDENNETPLANAVKEGHYEVVKLLMRNGASIHIHNMKNMSPIYEAAKLGNKEIVEHLTRNGANLDICDDNKVSPLHQASNGGHDEVVKYLLERDANVDIKDEDGRTPLHYSAEAGHVNVVKCLVDNDAFVDAVDKNLKTPLHLASKCGNFDCVKYLLDNNCTVQVYDRPGHTPLHYATANKHTAIANILRANGAFEIN